MNVIRLKGDDLEYWKKHSDLIDILSEWEEDGVLEISHELFPVFNDKDWDFFKKFLHKKDIHYTRSKKYNTFIYNIKNYTKADAGKVLDYIMYGDKWRNMMYNVLNRRFPKRRVVVRNNNNNNNNNNHNNNNNDKNDRPEIVLNNNNNNYMKRVPRAKERSKSMKKESKKRSKTLRKEYIKSKETRSLDDIMKNMKSLENDLRKLNK